MEGFAIYRPHRTFKGTSNRILTSNLSEKTRANELVSLNELNGHRSDSFLLDGTLQFGPNGQQRRYIQQIPFDILSIGGYEDTTLHTVGPDLWLQSIAGKTSNIWYRLKRPAKEYVRYHKPFIWLADLAKHVVDFLYNHSKVTLRLFKNDFLTWLCRVHGPHPSFQTWRSEYPRTDFRHPIAANAVFLYNQAGQLGYRYIHHPLWSQIDPTALTAIPRRLEERVDRRTVVTPYVYDCFKHLPWTKFLDPISYCNKQAGSGSPRSERDCLSHFCGYEHAHITPIEGEVRTGDIVMIRSDSNNKWKTNDEYWYAYVQDQKPSKHGRQLDLIWVYRPADTACKDMKYPHSKELFFSDHCNCGDKPIDATEVVRKIRVTLFGFPSSTDNEFFIRQTYNTTDCHWTSLQPSDFRCRCRARKPPLCEYDIGDTLLVRAQLPNDILEPVVLVEKGPTEDSSIVRVRRLLRKREDFNDYTAEPNELVYTTRIDGCEPSLIVRRCLVRFYTPEDRRLGRIPAPYNRKGTGDCYYILQNNIEDTEAIQLNQGFDPEDSSAVEPMAGLDIFCGGGNLGRGLEEGGVVKMHWAVDLFNEAIHTYHANSEGSTQFFNGSVNDYLLKAIQGRWSRGIARPEEVDAVIAGSPCPGLSTANRLYLSDKSLLNVSLVASVIAFVDFYRPKYVFMENVLGMANSGPKRTGEHNVFAQILCALLGLGYQVRPMMLDSWNFGAPQSRSRVFITAAAPGYTPLTQPPASHSHPNGVVGRSLGKAANGLPFGAREWVPTPFEYVTIGEATKDLPENPDARTTCLAYPDHRVTRNFSIVDNVRLSCIPRYPPGMTFVKSAKLGWQSAPQMATWHWDSDFRSSAKSKAWQRAKSNALLPTVTTGNAPNEALTGSALHWDAHRPLTVMEARRAQGYPDDEIIIGKPAMQWKIVGNSVTRQVAIALGMKLREAWLSNVSSGNERQKKSLPAEAYAIEEAEAGQLEQVDPTAKVKGGVIQASVGESKPMQFLEAHQTTTTKWHSDSCKQAKNQQSDEEEDLAPALKRSKTLGLATLEPPK